jgi:DDB1- and CUL4-associated factor 7
MPSHDHHARYEDRSSEFCSRIFETASTDLQDPQNLGCESAASNNLQYQTDVTSTSTSRALFFPTTAPAFNGSWDAAKSMSRTTVGSGAHNSSVTLPPNPYPPAQYQTLRRPPISGRQPDELHIPSASAAMGDYNRYQAPPAYGGSESLSINVQPSTPQHLSSNAGNALPGALQPGPMGRPGPLSSNTAPSAIPTLPHISTQMQQPPVSARPANLNHSHSYSRSSPTSLEQVKYKAFTNTPEAAKYGPLNAMNVPQTPQTSSYSPLGLADIRPRADTGFSDDPTSPGFYQGAVDHHQQYPQNSQYLAPWPIYASDWCKWPPRPHGGHAGKVAIGSYLEDNHNFVRTCVKWTYLRMY